MVWSLIQYQIPSLITFVNLIWFSTSTRCDRATVPFLTQLLINVQVYAILDEVFLAGEIEETSKEVVLARLEELEKLE